MAILMPVSRLMKTMAVLLVGGFDGWADALLPPEPPEAAVIEAPAELPAIWQFSFRAAQFPRAPAGIS